MESISKEVILAPYTMYKIGGPARFFVEPKNKDDLYEALAYAKNQSAPFIIIGAGSNILVSDKGFDGLVVHMLGGECRVDGDRMIVDAGVMMARAVMEAARVGLSGFEWGIGIPGTMGGSVRGNAGCFGGEIKNVVDSVEIFDAYASTVMRLNTYECGFGYRNSIFKTHPEWVIVSTTIKLQKGSPDAIQKEITRITGERVRKQDIGTKSCGCIFKNVSWDGGNIDRNAMCNQSPELEQFRHMPTIPASFLIDVSGLKGVCRARVCISRRHANYFVNEGGASADDVRSLIREVKDAVQKKFGISLQEEIQYIGFDKNAL